MDVEVRANGRLELRVGRPKGDVQRAAMDEIHDAILAKLESRRVSIEAETTDAGEDWIVIAVEGGW